MRSHWQSLASILLLLGVGSSHATASTNHFSGALSCVIGTGPENIRYTISGFIYTLNLGSQTGYCGVHWDGAANGSDVDGASATVYVVDDNGTTNGDLSCTPSVTTTAGLLISGATMHTCSTAGGCTAPSPTWASSSGQVLSLQFPTTAANIANAEITCSIPPFTAIGESQVISYNVITP